MPQRKGVNNKGSLNPMSYGEKANLNNTWCGTQERRVGTDSQIPFGYCCLSLQPVVEPVVSPTGHLYSRECILEYLLTKKEELGRQKIAYEAQNKKLAEEAHAVSERLQIPIILVEMFHFEDVH